MSERSVERVGGHPATRLPWAIAPWVQPFWYAWLAWCWWQVGAAEAHRAGIAASPRDLAIVLAGKLTVFLLEAAFYRLAWRSFGRDLPYWRFFCVVASASLADVLASGLARTAQAAPAWSHVIAAIAGLHAVDGAWSGSPGLRAAFGTLSVLTAVRIALTARAQARGVGVSMLRAFALTAAVWLLGRIVLLFTVDLVRGVSPLPAR